MSYFVKSCESYHILNLYWILSNLVKSDQILLNVSNIDKSLKILSNLVESCQTLSNLVFLHFKIFLSHFICIFNFEICSLIYLWLFSFSTYIQSCPVQSLPIFLPAQPFRLFFQSCFIVRWNEETRVLLRIILIFCPKYHIFLDKKDWKKRKWPLGIFRFLKTFWTIKIFRMIQLLQNFRIFKNVQKL